jgi:hypothetical protein
MTDLSPQNRSYELAFRAVELLAAACNIDMRHLHHRYHASTACHLLRREAAACLRDARKWDQETAGKVWGRHKTQATAK